MSNTYDISCHDCKVWFWWGQSCRQPRNILLPDYRDENDTNHMARFLLEHLGHRLEVSDEHGDYPYMGGA